MARGLAAESPESPRYLGRARGWLAARAPALAVPCAVALALMALILLPYMVAIHAESAGSSFYGSLRPSTDESLYLTAVRLGRAGDWLWHDPYAVTSPPPILMYPLYLLAGHLGALLGLSARASFILTHPVAELILLGSVWMLARLQLPRAQRRLFLAFAFCTGSLYWLDALLAAFGRAPVILTRMGMQHVSGFSLGFIVAHEAVGIAGHVAALTGLLGVLGSDRAVVRWRFALYGSAGMTMVGLTFPMIVPLTLIVLLLYTGWTLFGTRRPHGARACLGVLLPLGAIALPGCAFALYYEWVFQQPMWRQFQQIGALNPIEALLTWGALLPLAWWGWRRAAPTARPLADVLWLWCVCAAIGTWLNFMQGSRLPTGLLLPIGALVGLGLSQRSMAPASRRRWLLALSLGLVCQYLFLLTALLGGNAPHLYVTAARERALIWLAQHTTARDVILAPYAFGNIVPTAARAHVVEGDYDHTWDYAVRRVQVQRFYGSATAMAAREQTLRATRADYVIYDGQDADDGPFDPSHLPGLRVAYAAGGVTVLRVMPRP
jgi:hypothetical protein